MVIHSVNCRSNHVRYYKSESTPLVQKGFFLVLKVRIYMHGPCTLTSWASGYRVVGSGGSSVLGQGEGGMGLSLSKHVKGHFNCLKLVPAGVIPQCERCPHLIMDYTCNGVNPSSLPVAPQHTLCNLALPCSFFCNELCTPTHALVSSLCPK
jgi:hypothetical protein